MTTRKTIALTRWTFVGKVMSLLFNMPSRLVIAFLSRSKRLLISWLQLPSAMILEPPKIVCHCFHCFPIYLPWSDSYWSLAIEADCCKKILWLPGLPLLRWPSPFPREWLIGSGQFPGLVITDESVFWAGCCRLQLRVLFHAWSGWWLYIQLLTLLSPSWKFLTRGPVFSFHIATCKWCTHSYVFWTHDQGSFHDLVAVFKLLLRIQVCAVHKDWGPPGEAEAQTPWRMSACWRVCFMSVSFSSLQIFCCVFWVFFPSWYGRGLLGSEVSQWAWAETNI